MKKLSFFVVLFLLFDSALFAQVGINTDNSVPDNSAMLDVYSTTKGFLPPRMTTDQMNSIPTPSQGLIVYNITVNSLYWYNGSTWKQFNEPYMEADPVFTAHPAYGITTGNIGNWNTAFGWGNHATAGYLTSYTETDPVFGATPASGITAGNITNWNTAFTNRIIGATGSLPLTLSLSGNQLSGSISIANSTTNGYLTSTDWNTFNNKQNALTFGNLTSGDITVSGGTGAVVGPGTGLTINKGNLTESGSSVLTITGGGNSVLGTGTSIQVKQANTGQSGYLGSDDWNSFNNKVSSQWVANGLKLYYNAGNAGIGTSNPLSKVDIAGNAVIGSSYSGTNAAPANGLLVEGKVGVGAVVPAASAVVEVASTTAGVLLPRMTQTEIEAIASPANGLVVYCTTYDKFFVYRSSQNKWKEIAFGTIIINPGGGWYCGDPLTIIHLTSGGVAPVDKTVNYGTATNIPGETSKCWITSNLGADHQATAVNDATEPSAGWYWQFNRKQGYKHDGSTRTPNTTWISSISENSDWITANDPCTLELGSGWRIPTLTEWTNVNASGNWTDWNGPWNSALKMHAAGYLHYSGGSLNSRGGYGNYWSSTQYSSTNGYYLFFHSGASLMNTNNKASGFSVRCVREY